MLSIGGRGGGEAVVDASDAARRDRRLLALEYEAGRIPRLRQRLPTSLLTERRARELKGLPRCTHGVRRTALPSDQCGPTLVRKTGLGVLCGSMSMVSIERSSGDGNRPPSATRRESVLFSSPVLKSSNTLRTLPVAHDDY